MRLTPPGELASGIVVDLLFASSGIEADICAAAEPIEISKGLFIPVAASAHLVVMKVLSRSPERPQDETDLRALISILTDDDRRLATAAANQIEFIGANREKPLRAQVAALLQRHQP